MVKEHLQRDTFHHVYVCMVITYSRVWINRVRLPILLVVGRTGKMNIPLSPYVHENLSRETGSAGRSTVNRHEGFLIEGTATDTQAMVHLRNGSADADGYAASSAEECKSAHNAGPGQCSFDERSYKLTTFAVENFKPLPKSGVELVDRLASSLVRVADDGNLRRKGW